VTQAENYIDKKKKNHISIQEQD